MPSFLESMVVCASSRFGGIYKVRSRLMRLMEGCRRIGIIALMGLFVHERREEIGPRLQDDFEMEVML
jgi:hypothetical protein